MIPESCDVGLKEWAGICQALAAGEQSIILRKGGIDEVGGPGTFALQHPVFWLYPTHLHESQQGLRRAEIPRVSAHDLPPGKVPIAAFAVATLLGRIEDESMLDAFQKFHVWSDETIRNRFFYQSPGLWVLALRTYSRDSTYVLDVTPEQEGCRSWVSLGQALSTSDAKPAIDDDSWSLVADELQSLLRRTRTTQ